MVIKNNKRWCLNIYIYDCHHQNFCSEFCWLFTCFLLFHFSSFILLQIVKSEVKCKILISFPLMALNSRLYIYTFMNVPKNKIKILLTNNWLKHRRLEIWSHSVKMINAGLQVMHKKKKKPKQIHVKIDTYLKNSRYSQHAQRTSIAVNKHVCMCGCSCDRFQPTQSLSACFSGFLSSACPHCVTALWVEVLMCR